MSHLEAGVDELDLAHLNLKARLLAELAAGRLLHALIDLYISTRYAPHAVEQGAPAPNEQNLSFFDEHNRDPWQRVSIKDIAAEAAGEAGPTVVVTRREFPRASGAEADLRLRQFCHLTS